jgi:hydroxyacylglutathione hydrolase
MIAKVFDGLYAFIWQDYSQNNCNSFLIDSDKKILIDPGHKHLFSHIQQGLDTLNISLDMIDIVLATHGHPDHLEAVSYFNSPTKFTMNLQEYEYILKLVGNYYKIPEPDFYLKQGDLTIGTNQFEVIEAPGHTPGSICLYWPIKKALFAGDVVFQEGIGRTDLPGGSGKQLKESIKKIMGLDVEYLLTGHGGIVSGKDAVLKNFTVIEDYWFRYL